MIAPTIARSVFGVVALAFASAAAAYPDKPVRYIIPFAADSPFKTCADLVRAAKEWPDSVPLAGSGTHSAKTLGLVK